MGPGSHQRGKWQQNKVGIEEQGPKSAMAGSSMKLVFTLYEK